MRVANRLLYIYEYRARARGDRFAGNRGTSKYIINTPTLTHCSTTNMDPIEESIAAIESRETGEDLLYQNMPP
jgi:hypothetical protein